MTLQAIGAIGAALKRMLNAAGRCHARASMVVVRRTLLAFGFRLGRCGTIGLDEGWWVSVLLLQVSNALLSNGQLFQHLRQALFQFVIFSS